MVVDEDNEKSQKKKIDPALLTVDDAISSAKKSHHAFLNHKLHQNLGDIALANFYVTAAWILNEKPELYSDFKFPHFYGAGDAIDTFNVRAATYGLLCAYAESLDVPLNGSEAFHDRARTMEKSYRSHANANYDKAIIRMYESLASKLGHANLTEALDSVKNDAQNMFSVQSSKVIGLSVYDAAIQLLENKAKSIQ
ncbi:MAG: hypothetical protein NDI94_03440 [Candidatus Woesearchaeota archaeon]|nr:hypothetical protein [Candidatus Woesearchaeota archaeon]